MRIKLGIFAIIFCLAVSFFVKTLPMNICFAIDDKYVNPMLVATYSLMKNKKSYERVNIFVISDRISPQNKQRIEKIVLALGGRVSFIDVDTDNQYLNLSGSLLSHISKICLTKMRFAELFPENINRVLYLDADILVEGDIGKLYRKNLFGNIVAMTPDKHGEGYLKGYSWESEPFSTWILDDAKLKNYYNGGVILIDLKKWRKENIDEKMQQYFLKNFDDKITKRLMLLYNEQDIYNVVLNGKILELPVCWNYQVIKFILVKDMPEKQKQVTRYRGKKYIHHFLDIYKPWMDKIYPSKFVEGNSSFELYKEYMKEFNSFEKSL